MKFNADGAIKPMPNKDKIQNKDVLNKSADDPTFHSQGL